MAAVSSARKVGAVGGAFSTRPVSRAGSAECAVRRDSSQAQGESPRHAGCVQAIAEEDSHRLYPPVCAHPQGSRPQCASLLPDAPDAVPDLSHRAGTRLGMLDWHERHGRNVWRGSQLRLLAVGRQQLWRRLIDRARYPGRWVLRLVPWFVAWRATEESTGAILLVAADASACSHGGGQRGHWPWGDLRCRCGF